MSSTSAPAWRASMAAQTPAAPDPATSTSVRIYQDLTAERGSAADPAATVAAAVAAKPVSRPRRLIPVSPVPSVKRLFRSAHQVSRMYSS